MRKIKRNEQCPCESGKKYKNCCFNKDYEFFENNEGQIIKRIKLDQPIVQDILTKQDVRFRDIFGRERLGNDPIFPDTLLLSEEDYKEQVSEMLAMINVAPQIIYAFNKLGYCIVDGLQGKYTDQELADWKSAINEYFQIKEGKIRVEISSFAKNVEKIETSFEKLKLLYALIIHKYNKELSVREADDPEFLKSYCYFILSKNLKTIKSIEVLIDNNLGEDAIILIRSIYENYLQILMAIYSPQQLQDELNAKIGLIQNLYERKKGNFNTLINKQTKKEVRLLTGIKRATLNPNTKIEDEAIYSYLYNFLSSFTHPDISTIEQYIGSEGFTHVERNLIIESKLYLCLVNILLMSELIDSSLIDDISLNDFKVFISEINPVLQGVLKEVIEDGAAILPKEFLDRINKIPPI